MMYTVLATLADWTFFEIRNHGFESVGDRPLYGYEKVADAGDRDEPKFGELHGSLDRAIISAIGEKYTGTRSASGAGVGTAADWFARMIGMDELVTVDYQAGQKALQEALADTHRENTPLYARAQEMGSALERRGLVLATLNKP